MLIKSGKNFTTHQFDRHAAPRALRVGRARKRPPACPDSKRGPAQGIGPVQAVADVLAPGHCSRVAQFRLAIKLLKIA